jgi:hypothetical protein
MVERTGPLGLMRWRTMEPTPTAMPAPVMTTTTGVMPAMATTTMPMTTPMVGQTYTSVERTGPLGLMRWRTMEPTPTVMPAPIMTTPTPTAVMPAGATMPIPGTATTSTGVITGNYVVPSTSTTTVMPANYYTYERTGLFGRRYYVTPMSMDSTVMPASYAVPSTTYYYPQYSTYPQYSSGRYFGFGGFGFWMR